MRKKFGPTKYPRVKILYPRNTHENNFYTHEYPQEKMLDPRKTHEKKFWTHEIPTEKILGPQNTHEEKFRIHKTFMKKNIGPTMTQWYETQETHNGTRPTELSTLLLFTNHLLANGCVFR